jgi:hypothetical protein
MNATATLCRVRRIFDQRVLFAVCCLPIIFGSWRGGQYYRQNGKTNSGASDENASRTPP